MVHYSSGCAPALDEQDRPASNWNLVLLSAVRGPTALLLGLCVTIRRGRVLPFWTTPTPKGQLPADSDPSP